MANPEKESGCATGCGIATLVALLLSPVSNIIFVYSSFQFKNRGFTCLEGSGLVGVDLTRIALLATGIYTLTKTPGNENQALWLGAGYLTLAALSFIYLVSHGIRIYGSLPPDDHS